MSCKTMSIDLANVPPVPIQTGVAGENSFRTITFDASKWGADYPDATYTVVYRRSDGYLYPVLVNASADAIVWSPSETDTAVSGNGQLEVRLLDGETIGKTIIMQTYVAPSLSGDESEPSTPAPDWVNDVVADADRAEAAVSHYPQIRDGYWWVWDVENGEWVNTGVKATGEGGTSADAVLYTEQTLNDSQKAQARKNIGSKPPIYLNWDDTVDPGICEKSATEIALLFADGYDVHLPAQAFRGYDLRLRSAFVVDNALVVEFGDVFIKEGGGLENITATVDEQKHIDVVRTHISSAELEISQEIDDWESGKALDAGAAKDVLNQVLDDVGDELNSKANASDLARVATTGSYNDLSDKPTIPTVPTLAAVATSGSYNDLSDKPTIPSLTGYATETWVQNRGYQTATQVQTAISGVRQLPTGGTTGDFLRKDSNGNAAWETIPTYQGGSY